jgi:hypothetical protein
VLHDKTPSGAVKELTVIAIVCHLVRLVIVQSATRQHTAVERISFPNTLRWLGLPNTGIPLVALIVNPVRPHRAEPRVKRRWPRSFSLMIKPRQVLRHQRLSQEQRG